MKKTILVMVLAIALALIFTTAVGCASNGSGDSFSGSYSSGYETITFYGGTYKIQHRMNVGRSLRDVEFDSGSYTISGKKITLRGGQSKGDKYTIVNSTTIKDKNGHIYSKEGSSSSVGTKTNTPDTRPINGGSNTPANQPTAVPKEIMVGSLKDDDFEIKQNPDNTVTIVRFKLSNEKRSYTVDTKDRRGNPTTETREALIPFAEVIIPERIYGLPVTAIAEKAFSDEIFYNKKINRVVIPNSVTKIGNSAFASCDLASVTLPDGITSIGSAFRDNKLTNITIPDSVTTIEGGAFTGNQLSSVTLGSGLKTIGTGAFRDNKLTSITIPNSVTTIEDFAFSKNQLTSITLPAGLARIGESAFAANKLQSVTISAVIKDVGYNVFGENANDRNPNRTITRITLPANLSLYKYGFEDNFRTFYEGQGNAAGTYTKNGPIWARSTAGGID